MGYSVSWIAVKDLPTEEILKTLKLKKTGNSSEIAAETDLGLHDMQNGWQLVIANHDDLMTSKASWLAELSNVSELISVFVEEHVMYSAASGWSKGNCDWFVEHDSEDGLEDLKTKGSMPECFDEIRGKLMNELKNDPQPCDYIFDVPVELGAALTGFRHDRFQENDIYWELVTS